ncbi:MULTISPECIES: DUF4870 family protein [Acinetobacter]|jgi:uncharacterized membrane protein|uniref:Transmembrane protein n=1 Tax=Acinetobacter lwoffii NIPH 478 TaxID=1217668 RepID=N9GAV8_ACILW|nr:MULTISPECIES: DUF4870 domain-containing protein [Acinetobacter]ENW32062.1 hypothetical protein F923_00353 [Acinetobacter lwoffii NIPH 478]ENX14196.1 hypothetical protein F894_02428 [Acinetobacter sp. CIP 51.11]ENX31213.1 hypothetical protein F890_01172 [Acinetobacter sp. CIP 64.7]MBA4069128.1 hypothetical protein [Acinetobacter sp.]MCO8063134.1 hypothetical protein [Acinetobacter lwoffii]
MASAEDLKQYNLITYILYILGFFLGLTPFIAIVMNYIKRDEMRGTWLESHVDWQIKTFWISLLGYIVGGLLTVILIGFLIVFLVFIWHIYRLVKGLIALNNNQPIQA